MRVYAVFPNVSALELYDTLHAPEYRPAVMLWRVVEIVCCKVRWRGGVDVVWWCDRMMP